MPFHVLFLDQFATLGGGQAVGLEVLRVLTEARCEVTAAIPFGGDFERRAREIPGLTLVSVPEVRMSPGEKGPRDYLRFAGIAPAVLSLLPRLRRADIIYVNGPRWIPWIWAASGLLTGRVIYHVHLDHTDRQKRLLHRVLGHSRTAGLIVNSSFTKRRLEEADPRFVGHPKVMLLPNALSQSYTRLPFRQPSRYGVDLSFVTVGRVSREKGLDVIVDLARQRRAHTFHVIGAADFGDPEYEIALRGRATDNVRFAGKLEDVPAYVALHEVSAALLPSQVDESFGLAAIESMAMSCATIVSDRGELANIARQTGAWVASQERPFDAQVDSLVELSLPALTELALGQFERTVSLYSADGFARSLLRLVEPQ